jgi:hypothetical protein
LIQFLKIKLDGDVARGQEIIERLAREFPIDLDSPVRWSIDANAGWTPTVAMSYLTMLKQNPQLMKRFYMIEQPFPLEFEKVPEVSNEGREMKSLSPPTYPHLSVLLDQ